jgi:hypothetical protein
MFWSCVCFLKYNEFLTSVVFVAVRGHLRNEREGRDHLERRAASAKVTRIDYERNAPTCYSRSGCSIVYVCDARSGSCHVQRCQIIKFIISRSVWVSDDFVLDTGFVLLHSFVSSSQLIDLIDSYTRSACASETNVHYINSRPCIEEQRFCRPTRSA